MRQNSHNQIAPPLETQITKAIRQVLAHAGARTIKIHGGNYQEDGIADLLVCYEGRFVAIEVKRPGCKPTPLQSAFLESIRRTGGIAFVAFSVDDVVRELDLKVKLYPLFLRGMWASHHSSKKS